MKNNIKHLVALVAALAAVQVGFAGSETAEINGFVTTSSVTSASTDTPTDPYYCSSCADFAIGNASPVVKFTITISGAVPSTSAGAAAWAGIHGSSVFDHTCQDGNGTITKTVYFGYQTLASGYIAAAGGGNPGTVISAKAQMTW